MNPSAPTPDPLHFDPAEFSHIVVDGPNAEETWTAQQWNEYIDRCKDPRTGGEIIFKVVRLIPATRTCTWCDGTGQRRDFNADGEFESVERCGGCDGTGRVAIAAEDSDDDAPTCRDCDTWPCARHATDADKAEYAQAAAQCHTGAPAATKTDGGRRRGGNGPQDPATAAGLEYLPGHPGKLAQRPDWLDKPERQRTAEEIQTYRLDHCDTCRDAEFYGWSGTAAEQAHAAHLETVDVGPLKDTPCRCPKCVKSAQPPICRGCGLPETNCCCG